MNATYSHQPIYASRKATWRGCALTPVASEGHGFGRTSAFVAPMGVDSLLDRTAIRLWNPEVLP